MGLGLSAESFAPELQKNVETNCHDFRGGETGSKCVQTQRQEVHSYVQVCWSSMANQLRVGIKSIAALCQSRLTFKTNIKMS